MQTKERNLRLKKIAAHLQERKPGMNLLDTYATSTSWVNDRLEVNSLEEAENVIRRVAKKTSKLTAEREIDKLRKERLQLILDQIQQMLQA